MNLVILTSFQGKFGLFSSDLAFLKLLMAKFGVLIFFRPGNPKRACFVFLFFLQNFWFYILNFVLLERYIKVNLWMAIQIICDTLRQRCPTHSPLATCGEWTFKCGEWIFKCGEWLLFQLPHKQLILDKKLDIFIKFIFQNTKILWKMISNEVNIVTILGILVSR